MYQSATFQSVATLDTQTRMAMSLGDNRHYVVSSIMPRHFEQTAARCGFRPLKVKIGLKEFVLGGDDTISELAFASCRASVSMRMP